jgi:hypothetical protein
VKVLNVNIFVNGKQISPQEQGGLTMKNEIVSKIVHSAAMRYEKARLGRGDAFFPLTAPSLGELSQGD